MKPEWNQNGQYVVYEVPAGETLAIWRGTAASQALEGTPYYLKGGAEQIVFFPKEDKSINTRARIDQKSGEPLPGRNGKPDSRVEWKDVTGQTVPAPLRDRAGDEHVKGPFETKWGFSDWNHDDAKGIIVALPDNTK